MFGDIDKVPISATHVLEVRLNMISTGWLDDDVHR